MNNPESADMYPRRIIEVKTYSLWDEVVLYSPIYEKAFSLNSSAKAVWELCDGKRTVTEICHELGQRFDCTEADLSSDVNATVNQLCGFGLLKLAEPSESVSV